MSILDIEIKSSFKYQMIFALCAVIHLAFFTIFLIDEIYVLMFFNISSIIFYSVGALKSRKSSFEKNSIYWIYAVYWEITFHAVLCTLWIGFEACFYLYAMIVLIVASYVLYIACDKEKFLRVIFPFAVITVMSLVGCFVYLLFNEPLMFALYSNEPTVGQMAVMRGMNIFCTTLVIFIFSIMFIAEMHVLIKKLNVTNDQMKHIAMHDALTGLYNRYSIYELVSKHTKLSQSEEKVSPHSYCIIMGDIDDFKKINDTYGHDCGDAVLKEIAAILSDNVKEDDLICRWGGEEFLIIMHGIKQECLDNMKSTLLQVNAARVHSGEYTVRVTMTFGLVYCDELTEEEKTKSVSDKIDALVKIADERLYQGKNSGKNKVVFE
ncbi:MAG: GGDEF domain-containing protein [Firmicutes bacterium]|nr:GGDEF domain-containing protein [[Eubacterium] siraeum]MCM1487919.1 GGDEF domain-containing protein [Bacillota bacterium]